MKKIILFLILICTADYSYGQFNRLDVSTVNSIDSIINAHKAAHNWVGMSVGIVVNGEIAFLDGYGLASPGIDADELSVYRVASNTKSMTAVLILKLAEMGLLTLEDFVWQHVPEYPSTYPKNLIKIKHLLSNESGIAKYTECDSTGDTPIDILARDSYIASHGNYYDPVAAIEHFKDQPLCFIPGSNYHYSTWGFCLLAAVVEKVSGMSFQDFFYNTIVCPMNMPTLQIEFQDRVPYPYEVSQYKYVGGTWSCASCLTTAATTSTLHPADISYKMGGGGSIASVIDMALYMQGLVNNVFINSSSLTLMGTSHSSTPVFGDSTRTSTYGYAFHRSSDNAGNRVYRHGGDQTGTSTYLRVSPITKHGVVVMFNTQRVDQRNPLCQDLYNLLSSATLSPSPVFSPILYTWDVPPTSTHINPGTYESNYQINSTGQVHNGDNTQLKANKKIYLKTGFEAVQGSHFKVKVNNCD